MNKFNYKNLTPFKWFVLENFPFIENNFEAINNYQLFSKVVEYLNKTIDNMNLTGEQMENLTNAMTNLQNYVNNYFENLDVQEEINQKLDEMTEDGIFSVLISDNINRYIIPSIENLQNQINGLASGSPLSASSISEMTDTSRIYVNTSNGHWYYYNGTEWIDGGIYQASEDSETIENIEEEINNLNTAVFNENQEYVDVTNDCVLLDRFGITLLNRNENGFNKFSIETRNYSYHTIIGYPVNEGDILRIDCGSYYNNYVGAGYVFSKSTETPQLWNGSNSLDIVPTNNYDVYAGNTTEDWRTITNYNVIAPTGTKMIWVVGITPKIRILRTVKHSKIKDTIININEPIITTGTLTKQQKYSRQYRPAYLWQFSNVGSLKINNIKINANATDKVGIWVYVNEEMLTYRNNTDGTVQILIDNVLQESINTAYRFVSGWNYVPLNIHDSNSHNIEFKFTLVRGNYKFAIDTIELNYKTRPQILLSFDMSSTSTGNIYTDNRYRLLKQRNFVATFCNPDVGFTTQQLNKLFADGWDWSIYGGIGTRPDYDTGSLEDWKEYLQNRINACANIGLFNPISYFSPLNRGSVVIEQALKELGIKVARIAGTDYKINWFDDKNGLYIPTVGVGGTDTATSILEKIDDAINNNASICIFVHNVEDVVTDNMNCSTAVYTAILNGIKQRVENGLCDVVTFREFFNHWCPEDYEKLMCNRYEKEKQYILEQI